jgi:hypothetical protein
MHLTLADSTNVPCPGSLHTSHCIFVARRSRQPHTPTPSCISVVAAVTPSQQTFVYVRVCINQFWDNVNIKHPGKVFTVLPNNIYAKRAAANAPRGSIPGQNALASYQQAADAVGRVSAYTKHMYGHGRSAKLLDYQLGPLKTKRHTTQLTMRTGGIKSD